MRVLGIDTATRATSVAVWDTEIRRAHERRDDPPAGARPRHTTRLLALVVEALGAAGTDWAGIDLLAVGIGPGTFTGIRIGVSSARALAAARGLPILGVSTLRALASGTVDAAGDADRYRLAVLDARRGEVFAAGWPPGEVRDPHASPRIVPSALAPAELARTLSESSHSWLAVGEGAVASRDQLTLDGVTIPGDGSALHRVTATEVCRLALDLPPRTVEDIRPEYLRLPDAELSRRAAEVRTR